MIQDLYEVQKLLDRTRICMIPVVNPDGYEIFTEDIMRSEIRFSARC